MSPQPLQPAQTPDHPAKPDGEEEVGESQTRPPLMGVAFWFGYEEEEEFKVVGWEEECFNNQPKEYAKGPDIEKKAAQTKWWYREAMKTQHKLEYFGLAGNAPIHMSWVNIFFCYQSCIKSGACRELQKRVVSYLFIYIQFPYPQLFTLPRVALRVIKSFTLHHVALRINACSSLTEPEVYIPMESEEPNLNFEENEPRILPSESTPKSSTHPTASISAETESSQSAKDDAPKDGEDELTKTASLTEIHSWEELQEQVKSELASAKKRAMPLSQITQLLIIRNYVTL
ncbi:hypothetical protein DFH05DRAFT_1461752 [Lentinula detonsa]|uniref:Uncharacterized protein n=1 Tax=Lentinula detonsa TaxID=2804962 RepID=A0A9W8NXC0_9AGAR|nr:hypothetical protein DFH05DRAFT_1461752 [Lentinula detonsa]